MMTSTESGQEVSNPGRHSDMALADKGVTDREHTYAEMETGLQTAALFSAIYAENETEVKRLVRNEGVITNVIDEADPTQPTALIAAVKTGNAAIVRLMLRSRKHPADVNREDCRGKRPIWFAAEAGNTEIAEVLVSDCKGEKCDCNYIDRDSGMTPLYRAILSGSSETCRIIVRGGANVNMRRLGLCGEAAAAETPLIKAVQMDNLGICQVLVNSLVDIHAKTSLGFTALHYAVGYRRYKCAEYLLQEQSKVMAKSNKGITPMTVAISEDLPLMVRLLIEFGYRLDKRFEWGETPLEMATRMHVEDCALTMVVWGASLTRKNKNNLSYFSLACNEGLLRLLRLLVELNPLFLNERWVQRKQIPFALYREVETVEWLFQNARTPRKLYELCKSKIFRRIGKWPIANVDKLPLPDSLREDLKYKQYFTGPVIEKKYREKQLNTRECPFDCGPVCDLAPQCPTIEFSDSGSEYELDFDSD